MLTIYFIKLNEFEIMQPHHLSTPGLDPRGGVVLPYMGYIGMCCCEGYGFQAVYSSQSVWV